MPTAFITGASSGIGAAIAIKLWGEGFSLLLTSKNEEKLKLFVQQFAENQGQEIKIFAANLEDKSSLNSLINFVKSNDSLDVLVNNAGIYNYGTFTEESDEIFESLINVNFKAPYFITKHLIEKISKSDNANIINICSVTVKNPRKEAAAYTISKMGMEGLNRILAIESKARNIRNVNIYPAAVNTASWDGIEAPKADFIQAEDIANLVAHCIKSPKNIIFDDIHLSNPINF